MSLIIKHISLVTLQLLGDANYKHLLNLTHIFKQNQYSLYVVGGAVRDILYGISPSDIDLVTDATPVQVTKLMHNIHCKVIETGISHGTVTMCFKQNQNYEITTFRQDVSTFGRRAEVKYSKSMKLDSERRDFTMNALYLCLNENLIYDFHGGINDLKKGALTFVGSAKVRAQEDWLRILRFFRFSIYYGTKISEVDFLVMNDLKDKISHLSRSRINQELFKILSYSIFLNKHMKLLEKNKNLIKENKVEIIKKFITGGLFSVCLPGIVHENMCFIEKLVVYGEAYIKKLLTKNNVALVERIWPLILVSILIKPMQQQKDLHKILNHLGFSNKENKYINFLVRLKNIFKSNSKFLSQENHYNSYVQYLKLEGRTKDELVAIFLIAEISKISSDKLGEESNNEQLANFQIPVNFSETKWTGSEIKKFKSIIKITFSFFPLKDIEEIIEMSNDIMNDSGHIFHALI